MERGNLIHVQLQKKLKLLSSEAAESRHEKNTYLPSSDSLYREALWWTYGKSQGTKKQINSNIDSISFNFFDPSEVSYEDSYIFKREKIRIF